MFWGWKRSTSHPLFPSGGIHWSGYAVPRAADTLRHFFNAKSYFQLPAVHQTGLQVGVPPRGTDDDLLKLLNMFVAPSHLQPLAYPALAFDAPRSAPAPRVLLVADSFAWSLVEFYPYFDNWFSPGSHFWFYNREVVWPKVNGEVPPPTDVAAHDVVLLLFSEQNLLTADIGFSANALATFTKPSF